MFKVHDSEKKNDHPTGECDICQKYFAHQISYREARDEYQSISLETTYLSFTVDMQKVMLIPKLTSKEHVFITRLVVFNETFASLDGMKDLYILWHKGIAERSVQDFASAILKCIKVTSSRKYLFWADNCSGQNKNWYLFTLFAKVVNSDEWDVDTIRIKYLA